MAYTKLNRRFTPSARVEETSSDTAHYRLTIPAGKADEYRLAQIDDYTQIRSRRLFPHRVGLTLSLFARTSSPSLPGTWGFGLWNDPFGLSIGFGGKPFRLPALPNAVWFFGASKQSHLSFSDKPANGFLAQSFRSPRFHPLLIPAGLALPFSSRWTRRLLGRVIAEDGAALDVPSTKERAAYATMRGRYVSTRHEEAVSVDPTQWHKYRLEWSLNRVSFEVDEARVFESSVSPNPPLGLVIWIDNQYAAFTPKGKIGFGVLANSEPAWLEIKGLEAS
jgi:hypothetical protein